MEREKLLELKKDQQQEFKIRQTSVSPHSKERKPSAQRKNSSQGKREITNISYDSPALANPLFQVQSTTNYKNIPIVLSQGISKPQKQNSNLNMKPKTTKNQATYRIPVEDETPKLSTGP